MKALRIEIFDVLARLLAYPCGDYHSLTRQAAALLRNICPQAAALLDEFVLQIADQSPQQLEELYTRTFDVNPICCLEVGWHLYGDNYDRGDFLVRMRRRLRELGLEEGQELPDHLMHVLPVVGHLPEDQSAELAAQSVLPAVDKMLAGLRGKQSPFEPLLQAVKQVLLSTQPVSTRSAP